MEVAVEVLAVPHYHRAQSRLAHHIFGDPVGRRNRLGASRVQPKSQILLAALRSPDLHGHSRWDSPSSIWFLVGTHFTERYLKHMSCVLTERSLKVSRGIFVRQEQTVPLDKITDLALIEGPVMRCFDLQAMKVETAGHSSTGALITLVGIVDARKFRDTVLRQRDAVASAAHPAPTQGIADPLKGSDELLREIRDTLMRIENKLP